LSQKENSLLRMFKKIPVIENDSLFNLVYFSFILLTVLISSIIISYRIVFDLLFFDSIYFIIILIYLFDIVVSFNSDVRVKFEVLKDRKQISKRYLNGRFTIDLLTILPIGLIYYFLNPEPDNIFQQIIGKILLALPLLKLLKVRYFVLELNDSLHINPNIRRLVALLYWLIIGVNFAALGWCFIGATESNRNFFDQYLRAVYWCITTIATIGYGDYSPSKDSNLQIIYTIFIELSGVAVFGFIIGNIANLISNLDMVKSKFSKHLEEINVYLQSKNIPYSLQQRVNNYYFYLWEVRKGIDSKILLEDMPHTLKEEILMHLNRSIIEKVSIFQHSNELFLREIVQLLEPVVFLPDDYIIRQGEIGSCMYFLNAGEVNVVVNNVKVAQLGSGSHFGETALLQDENRMGSIVAITYCETYRLTKQDFDSLRARYPEFDEKVKEIVLQRMADTEQRTR